MEDNGKPPPRGLRVPNFKVPLHIPFASRRALIALATLAGLAALIYCAGHFGGGSPKTDPSAASPAR